MTNTTLLKNLNKSKNPMGLAKKHGFNSIEEYTKYLEAGITKIPIKEIETKVEEIENKYFLAVDVSGSTSNISKEIQKGVIDFCTNLAKSDDKAKVTIVEFGTAGPGAINVIKETKAKDIKKYVHRAIAGTPLHEAFLECLLLSKNDKNSTIVVFTDGDSTSTTKAIEDAKAASRKYEGTLVFIGAGNEVKPTALGLSVPEGNILKFDTTPESVLKAYNTLNTATSVHSRNVKEGKVEESKTEYFKTKTDIAAMLRKSANKEIKVAFEKKIDEKANEGLIYSFLNPLADKKGNIKLTDIKCKELAKLVSTGELRVLRGSHVGDKDEFGRYVFTDFDIPAGQHATRLVNPDTIQWVEIDGIKYTKK